MKAQKKLVREQFRRKLSRKPPVERSADSAALCDRLIRSAIWEETRTVLFFAPLKDEEYDFLSLRSRIEREPVRAFLDVLRSVTFREALAGLPGFVPDARTGEVEP